MHAIEGTLWIHGEAAFVVVWFSCEMSLLDTGVSHSPPLGTVRLAQRG